MEASAQRQGSRVRFAEEEEEPGLEVLEAPKGLDGAEKGRASSAARAGVGAASAPEVYWAPDGDDNDPESAKYTFYREGTPTPPEYEDDHVEKAGFGHARGSHGAVPVLAAAAIARAATARASLPDHGHASPTYNSGGGMEEGQDGEPQSTRKRWALLIGIALVLIAIPIAIGVGLGVGLRNQALGGGSSSGAAAGASSSASPTGTSPNSIASSGTKIVPSHSTTSTSTKSTGTSSSRAIPTATGAIPNLDCPSANNTLYTVPGMTKTFLHVCGIDYSGATGSTDLSHVYTSSMAECLNVCASYDRCTGAGWGFVSGDAVGATSHRCWMKTNLGLSHTARGDYCFGILQS
ncbi:hypothetical protein QBC34DRAFT_139557 [Podospora aff. communis PSN243]|uniref:Apple domain-containing protein n=1 Tax=Podospora aff. communis PSN243 TaxID=3040156 RepID=A0AAV9H4P6_9PEZI|nr:hypothetical protein QBC34DRAFT_139557 [Podospora aff. communis PSN243]